MDHMTEAQSLFEYAQALRRDFHAHPELGFKEVRTSSIVAGQLAELGLEVQTGVAETGVVALIPGNKPGPVLLVRADMDALPIREETGAPYESQNPGVMHACGHDAHTAILLSVAKILHARRDQLAGTVKLVFQPAEEGLGGAERMILEGVLDNPKPDLTLALHVWNEKPLGWIGISTGPALAGAEIFKIKIHGKGGHGAAPHTAMDPVLAASNIVTALQSIVARNIDPLQSAVVSVCTFHGGEAFNVIPQEVELTGTIRTFDLLVRDKVLERFEIIVHGLAETFGCRATVDLQRLTPAVINHSETATRIQGIARQLFPDATIDSRDNITMGSEDFAFVMERVPGCFFFIGSANKEKSLDAGHHHPRFDIDEQALVSSIALMTATVMDILK